LFAFFLVYQIFGASEDDAFAAFFRLLKSLLCSLHTHSHYRYTLLRQEQPYLDTLQSRHDIAMFIPTLLALVFFTYHIGSALVLAQGVITTHISTLTIPIFTYVAQSSNTTIAAIHPIAIITTTQSTPTTIEPEHQTLTFAPDSTSPTTPSTDPTATTTVFNTKSTSIPAPNYSRWVLPATASLLCYDFVIMVAFAWCWVTGWFWWWKKIDDERGSVMNREREMEERMWRAMMDENVERRMRRLGMV
jgi:hypothetical protein